MVHLVNRGLLSSTHMAKKPWYGVLLVEAYLLALGYIGSGGVATYFVVVFGSNKTNTSSAHCCNGCKMYCSVQSDRRVRHGRQDAMSACFSCLQEEDTVSHIFMGCVYARQVWFSCFHTLGLHG
jgi:hypothetical protein